MDAFDADVLIYAASGTHHLSAPLRRAITQAVSDNPAGRAGVGSVLLLTETLIKPLRHEDRVQSQQLTNLLERLELLPCDRATTELALALGAEYGLKTVDAVHLATAISAGADRFITNNRKDFSKAIEDIDITYPEDLVTPSA